MGKQCNVSLSPLVQCPKGSLASCLMADGVIDATQMGLEVQKAMHHEGNKAKKKGVQASQWKPNSWCRAVSSRMLLHNASERSLADRSLADSDSSPGPAELDPGLARECEGMNRGPHGQGMVFVIPHKHKGGSVFLLPHSLRTSNKILNWPT